MEDHTKIAGKKKWDEQFMVQQLQPQTQFDHHYLNFFDLTVTSDFATTKL